MEGLLDCSTCARNFDLDWRRPRLLPCGHTLCNGCVWESHCGGNIRCPFDKQLFLANPDHLQDDLQLLCWLEATAQGVLECICCRRPFDRLLRRPAALGCGHAVCRVCLVEANEVRASPPSGSSRRLRRRDSVDESWDYSQEDGDGDSGSSLSSLPSDPAADDALIVDCPVDGCRSGVDAKDHQHLVGILDGSAPEGRVERRRVGPGPLAVDGATLSKLEQLEAEAARRLALLEMADAGTDNASLDALLKALRSVVEHKNSPRSEQSGVFKPLRALPDLCAGAGLGSRQLSVEVFAVTSLKDCMEELDVWNLALCGPGEMRVKKEALLHSDKKVWKLTGVDCWCDPDWTLRLLRRVAPDVEQLQLRYPGREHLQVVRDCMPHLRRLEVRGWAGLDLLQEPFSFDEGPAANRDTLEWLEVFLPSPTAMSLLRAHQCSLRKLRLMVADEWSAEDDEGDGDPVLDEEDEDGFCVVGEDALRSHCWDDLLVAYGAGGEGERPLASLSLLWPSSRPHDSWRCRRFVGDLRATRPHLLVDCDVCRANGAGSEV